VVEQNDNYNNYGGQERLVFTNTSAITSLSITVHVVQTTGITYNSESNSFPGGALNQSESVSGGVISYMWVSGQTIPANYSNGTIYAQYGGTGYAHAQSGDTWTVTSTSNGITSTLSGTF
jgi:hypothetical protein